MISFLIYSDGEVNVFMEYMDGGSLDVILRKIGKIPEPYTRKITHAVSFKDYKLNIAFFDYS